MLDLLAAILIDAAGVVSPKFKEETRRELAEARIEGLHQRQRSYAMAAQVDAIIDTSIAETDRTFRGLDPLYTDRLNRCRIQYGLPPVG